MPTHVPLATFNNVLVRPLDLYLVLTRYPILDRHSESRCKALLLTGRLGKAVLLIFLKSAGAFKGEGAWLRILEFYRAITDRSLPGMDFCRRIHSSAWSDSLVFGDFCFSLVGFTSNLQIGDFLLRPSPPTR
jgi:hypothetical protein